MTIIQDVKPTGMDSAYVEKPFDEAKKELETNGYHVASLEEVAKLRISQGITSHVTNCGSYVREGFIYVPQRGIFLTKKSPIMTNAKKATNCHRNGNDFYLTNEQVKKALTDSILFKNSKSIPTNRFAEDEITVFAFGKTAENYGKFLEQANIKKISIYLANFKKKPFARQVWLHGLDCDCGSKLVGDGGLNYYDVVRGVKGEF